MKAGARPLHPWVRVLLLSIVASACAAFLAQPLDLWLGYARFPALAEDAPAPDRALVVTLEEADLRELSQGDALAQACPGVRALPYFEGQGHLAWRAVHACLLRKLAAAQVKVAALDLYFTEDAPEASAPLMQAIAEVRERGLTVVLGWHFSQALRLPLHARAPLGLLEVREDTLLGRVRRYALCDGDLGAPGQCLPALALQAWSLSHGEPARCVRKAAACVVEWPKELSGRELLGLRPSRDVTRLSYAQALLHPDVLARALGERRAVFIGLAGEWARRGGDVLRLPFDDPDSLRTDGFGARELPGLFVHALAFHELGRAEVLREAGPGAELFVLLLAYLVGAVPCVLVGLWPHSNEGLFSDASLRPGLLARARVWPWPLLCGPLLIGLAVLASWSVPWLYPVGSALAVCVASAIVWSWPALRARRQGHRCLEAILSLDRATRAHGWPALVRLPQAGPAPLAARLEAPALTASAAWSLLGALHDAIVEAEAARTFPQRLPRRFFVEHGWLPDAAEATLDQPPARAAELSESFYGTISRRLRNLRAHAGLAPHAVALATQALESLGASGGALAASSSAAVRTQLLERATDYLRAAAQWVAAHPPPRP
ncbi:MAG: CHASE2 domain-containing protein [Deltaproteobacteria bacterium]|nr:CHASE2 domain-containing protein [Deltaproteobacteria bacterium]